ncbi:hypothetical protein CS542_07015 [Pedobacter sp. IW39]|nr:hypothetical protein CS542_07015 [Pedobacter sp. IW39]
MLVAEALKSISISIFDFNKAIIEVSTDKAGTVVSDDLFKFKFRIRINSLPRYYRDKRFQRHQVQLL